MNRSLCALQTALRRAPAPAALEQRRAYYGPPEGSKPAAVVILGPPGVGKRTYSAKCADYFGLVALTTGQLMMDEIAAATDIGQQVLESARSGAPMADAPILRVVTKHLMKAHSEGVDRFVMDGFPRNVAQAQALDQIADVQLAISLGMRREVLIAKCMGRRACKHCHKTFNVTDINLPATEEGLPAVHIPPYLPPESCKAFLEVRKDDQEADVERRLEAYERSALLVLRYYQERRKLLEFEVTGGVEDTMPRLLQVLRPHLEVAPLAPLHAVVGGAS